MGARSVAGACVAEVASADLAGVGLWIDSARLAGDPPPGDRFPVAEAAVAGGLLLGRRLSPLTSPNAAAEMDRVADCFTKILIDHGDRVRQLTTERAEQTP